MFWRCGEPAQKLSIQANSIHNPQYDDRGNLLNNEDIFADNL